MLNTLKKISTANMSREEWLKARKQGIGGSDAAAVIGLSPWASPFSVWMNKTGKEEDSEDNERLRQGRDLEEYVAQRFCESTEKKVRRVNAILINPQYPWAIADIDRAVIGEDAILECKTTSVLQLKKYKNGEYPVQYYVQCQHYMAVTGCKKVYLAVLVLQHDFIIYEIERDEGEIAALMEQEKHFWEDFVVTGEAPAPDGSDVTTDSIKQLYPEANTEQEVELYGMEPAVTEYFALDSSIKELESRKQQIVQEIKKQMGTAAIGVANTFRVSWKNQSRTYFDSKKFREDHPEMDLSEYLKESMPRTFRLVQKPVR